MVTVSRGEKLTIERLGDCMELKLRPLSLKFKIFIPRDGEGSKEMRTGGPGRKRELEEARTPKSFFLRRQYFQGLRALYIYS